MEFAEWFILYMKVNGLEGEDIEVLYYSAREMCG